MKLLDLIRKNSSLRFYDLKENRPLILSDLLKNILQLPNGNFLTFLYTDNSIASVSTLLSFWSCENAVIALFSKDLASDLKITLEELYKPCFIADDSRKIIDEYNLVHSTLPTQLFRAKHEKEFPISEKIKLLLPTSGTTGSPKLVKLSETNVIENALSIICYLPIEPTDNTPLNLPIFYSYGFSIFTTNAIAGGTIFTSVDDILKSTFWDQFRKYNFTSLAGVPVVYEMLNRLGFQNFHLPSLRYFTQAGGRLNEELINKFYNYSIQNNSRFFVMYGQTEATARMAFLPPEKMKTKIGSIGRPIKNGQFKIDDETNELLYSGPNVFGGYCESYEDLAVYDQPDWLKTGDVARMDDDGFFYITGRLKRFAKIAGNRINLDELDAHIKKHFDSHELACINKNDKKILIFLKDQGLDLEALLDFLRNKFGIHHSFVQVHFIDEIPLTLNGKIDLQHLYGLKVEG